MKQNKFNDKLKTENDHFWENLSIKANQTLNGYKINYT